MNNIFDELIEKLNQKKKHLKPLSDDALKLMNAILKSDSDNDEKNKDDILKKIIMSDEFKKRKYYFKLLLIPKTIPVKKPTPLKFDYDMKDVYCVDIIISDNNNYCEITLNREDLLDTAKEKYLFWKDYINNNSYDEIINHMKNII